MTVIGGVSSCSRIRWWSLSEAGQNQVSGLLMLVRQGRDWRRWRRRTLVWLRAWPAVMAGATRHSDGGSGCEQVRRCRLGRIRARLLCRLGKTWARLREGEES